MSRLRTLFVVFNVATTAAFTVPSQYNGHGDALTPFPSFTTTTTTTRLQEAMSSSSEEQQRQHHHHHDSSTSTSTSSTSSMNKLRDALQKLELQKKNSDPSDIVNLNYVNGDNTMPMKNREGIYEIHSKQQHSAFLKANPDKLVVMKFTAAYCKACAALKPKFHQLMHDESLKGVPICWAEFKASPTTKALFRRLGVLSLPTVHFYNGSNGLVENFQCGPAKLPVLVKKLTQFLNRRVDPETMQLKAPEFGGGAADAPRKVREIRMGDELITEEHINYLRDDLPFFEELTDEEFDDLLAKASLQTFLPGDVVMRQGMPGVKFFVVKSGNLEMSIKSRFDDPISTPPSYLGAVVNTLSKFDYFGERALTTGEPYCASVRALDKSRCFVFNVEDIPEASILSQKRRGTRAFVDKLTERYRLPEDYQPFYNTAPRTGKKDESILELLVRFKQIRKAAKCFEYFMESEPLLGDRGAIARRSLLVSKLSESQRQDIIDVFNMADVNRKGTISLLEMRRFMDTARKERTDQEIIEMISKANPSVDGSKFGTFKFGTGITLDEFMGIMAEAEFYYLFTEIFQELDKNNTGYVRAGDLDEVLHGVRDLISGDRKSVIDVEDQDVHVDYEQFAKMLLGAAL